MWAASKDVSNYSLVARENVCLLGKVGGLGIWRVGLFNQALLDKWLWCLGKESHIFWRQVIATKFGDDRGGWCTRGVRGMHGCGMWKGIRKVAKKFFGQIVYHVGEGHCVRF